MMRCVFIFMLLVGLATRSSVAQSLDLPTRNAGAYYTYVDDPSDITIEVKVWGSVQNPGLYEVRQGLNLSTLLTLAGGPLTSSRGPRMKSALTLRLYRLQPGGQYVTLYETLMQDELIALDQDPVLTHGDMLVVDEKVRQSFGWRDGLSVLTALGTIALVIERVASSN
jgi:hypothetical protein